MNLYSLLQRRTAAAGPIRVGVIGAGKFASMFLTQAVNSESLHLVGVADINIPKARAAMDRTGWPAERYAAADLDEAVRTGGTAVIDSSDDLIAHPAVEVILEVTGNPIVGTRHAVAAIDNGKHVIMVNVEADCMVGPILARRAAAAGVVYAMAYGDQPALICELVDWCRTVGFDVVCAGKGTKHLPEYTYSTPDTVCDYYGLTDEQLHARSTVSDFTIVSAIIRMSDSLNLSSKSRSSARGRLFVGYLPTVHKTGQRSGNASNTRHAGREKASASRGV